MIEQNDPDWLLLVEEALGSVGYAVVTGFIPEALLERLTPALYAAQRHIEQCIGRTRLERAGERGVLRLLPQFDPVFTELLALPAMLQLVDHLLEPTAILHVQNGFILPPGKADAQSVFQHRFHMDFPRYLNGYLASVNVFLAVDTFDADNGATLVVPGTQQHAHAPSALYLQRKAQPLSCPAGSAIVFDSTLWHAAGENRSPRDRLAINHQFTRSWIKQQIDYCRALDTQQLISLPERTQQLLGYYTRVVTSLDEFYQPEERRLYRRGQG